MTNKLILKLKLNKEFDFWFVWNDFYLSQIVDETVILVTTSVQIGGCNRPGDKGRARGP